MRRDGQTSDKLTGIQEDWEMFWAFARWNETFHLAYPLYRIKSRLSDSWIKEKGNWLLTLSLLVGERTDKMRYTNTSGRFQHQNVQMNIHLEWKYLFLKNSLQVFVNYYWTFSLCDCDRVEKWEQITFYLVNPTTSKSIIQYHTNETSTELIKFIFYFLASNRHITLQLKFTN